MSASDSNQPATGADLSAAIQASAERVIREFRSAMAHLANVVIEANRREIAAYEERVARRKR